VDTREKIRSLQEAEHLLSAGSWIVVPGVFDPLTNVQARRLTEISDRARTHQLMAIVLKGRSTLLTAEARAALVAALRTVGIVAIADEHDWRSHIPQRENIRVIEDAEGEERRSAEFVEFVLERQRSAMPNGAK
jgi:hypothetical protein